MENTHKKCEECGKWPCKCIYDGNQKKCEECGKWPCICK